MDLKPGLSVRIVTDLDVPREIIFVKSSIVYDAKEWNVILAQTDPPIVKSMLHKGIVVTYLVERNGVMVRHGFSARIVTFIDYALESGEMVNALVVERTGEERVYDIRMFYRVGPTNQSNLSMTIHGTPMNVLDLSLGGAKVSYDKSLKLQPNAVVNASMEMNGKSFAFVARILRTWDGESEGLSPNLRFASVEFTNMDNTVEHALLQKIRDIEREPLQKERIS